MKKAFTLIEILVVVAVIVILIAILVPALDKAMTAAGKAKCLAHQAGIVKACQMFTNDYENLMPPCTQNGQGIAHTYDLRTTEGSGGTSVGTPILGGAGIGGVGSPVGAGAGVAGVGVTSGAGTRFPLNWGMLVVTGRLPSTQLGKMVHCPAMDNLADANAKGHCMDVPPGTNSYGVGGSWWVDSNQNAQRVIVSYNYRATPYFKSGNGNIRANKVGSNFIISTDTPDYRWRGEKGVYAHPDGFNRVFADGSGSFRKDENHEIEQKFIELTGGKNNFDGMTKPSEEEQIYTKYLAPDQ